MKIDPIELTKKLIHFNSITPEDDGAIEYLREILDRIGFKCHILEFGTRKVKNLYARYGAGMPNLCFAGHIDVVDSGKLENWRFHPFKPSIENGILYGRGAADMKSGVASFISATVNLILEKFEFYGSISILITSAEEDFEEYGTKSVLKWMQDRKEYVDYCVIGEPTSSEVFGDTIKIGRRGSLNFKLTCYGKQGHVAYPY
ncbi:M20/M25/M40 family metallo-hydrolase, partial [Wolbachia endosymbiont of Pentidionis agamae]|uniref:M20/M25/M40 family metallo-hydrolase n=1 Tax=Wolbachia endosymbiont of Pentidionis agamae TaxID=3110435 RepID=UPI002FD0FAA4